MKILFNAQSLNPPLTGIGNYTYQLLRHLRHLDDIEDIECFVGPSFLSLDEALARCERPASNPATTPVTPDWPRLRSLLRRVPLAYRTRAWLQGLQLTQKTARLQNYLYHEPNFILQPHKGPCVTTIHDLSFVYYPQYHPAERVNWLCSQLPKTLARADMIITPAELIRQELINDYGIPGEKIRAIYHGVLECFQPQTAEQTRPVLQRHDLQHGRYLLFVATLEPRKGIDVLLDAWSSLPEALRREWPLVLAGAPGWKNQELLASIRQLSTSAGLRHLNFVPADELPALYAGAALFIYPSVYEGFGLPVLEAMSSGVATISTAETTMAEFAGDSIALIERGNREQLTELLRQLLENPAQRKALAQAGQQRASHFTWEKCARETAEAYRMITR